MEKVVYKCLRNRRADTEEKEQNERGVQPDEERQHSF